MTSLIVYGLAYPVIQINGQKIIGPCKGWELFGQSPNLSMEIFVNRLPHHLTEIELLPIFASIGPIWKFRLMMNFSGQNRGFAYLQYVHEESYVKAFQVLNGIMIAPRFRIYLKMSRNICTLMMGDIDGRFDKKLVVTNLQTLVCCKDVNLVYDHFGKIIFIIEFFNHRDTAMARRKLLQYLPAFGDKAWVRWGPH